jgi:hypothetical protein
MMRGKLRQLSTAMVILLGATLPSAADEPPPFNPFEVPRETFTARVHTIALARVIAPLDVENGDELEAQIGELIRVALVGKGYEVVGADEVDRIRTDIGGRLGGVFDPVTGIADEATLKTTREHVGRELSRLHGVDAILHTNIRARHMPWGGVVFGAPMAGGEKLEWHDGSRPPNPTKVVGTYLDAVIVDTSMVVLYSIRVPSAWWRVYAARDYFERPDGIVFFDADRNQDVVMRALSYLPASSGGGDLVPANPGAHD